MAFASPTPYDETRRLKREVDELTNRVRFNIPNTNAVFQSIGANSAPITKGEVTALFSLKPTIHIIHDLNAAGGTPTGTFNKITLVSSSVLVDGTGTNLELRTIYGTINNGQILLVKPVSGKTLTLKTGDNINITVDLLINDDEFVLLQYQENSGNKYNVLTGAAVGDNLGNHTATQALRMNDFAIFFDTALERSMLSLGGALNYSVESGAAHDFYVNTSLIPRFGITDTFIASNVDFYMANQDISFVNQIHFVSPTGDTRGFAYGGAGVDTYVYFVSETGAGIYLSESGTERVKLNWNANIFRYTDSTPALSLLDTTDSTQFSIQKLLGTTQIHDPTTLKLMTASTDKITITGSNTTANCNVIPNGSLVWELGNTSNLWAGILCGTVFFNSARTATITKNGTDDLEYRVPTTSDTHILKFGATTAYTFDFTTMNVLASKIIDIGELRFDVAATLLGTDYYIARQGSLRLTLNVPSGKDIAFSVNGTREIIINSAGLRPDNDNDQALGDPTHYFGTTYTYGLSAKDHVLLEDRGSNPTVDGQMVNNGGDVIIQSGGSDRNLSDPTFDTLACTGIASFTGSSTTIGDQDTDTFNILGKSVYLNGIRYNVTSTSSSSYTVGVTEYVLRCTSTGNQTINLPTASGIAGRYIVVYKTAATGTVTIDPSGSETIEGSSTITITSQYGLWRLMSDGTNWMIL